jgi:hypothetical protein
MPVEIRLPNITATTEKEQLAQVKSYLYQLAQQLQWAMDNISTREGAEKSSKSTSQESAIGLPSGVVAQSTFNAIKPLIINSKEIISAYYREIGKLLDPDYVSETEYADRIGSNLRAGILYYDLNDDPVFGLEIGQKRVVGGVESFDKFARFTEDRISLYDNIGKEVLYISGRRLYMEGIEIRTTGSINGAFIDTKAISDSESMDIHTAYDDFDGNGDDRQSIFIFGADGSSIVSGVVLVSNSGEVKWQGTEGVTVSTREGGWLRINLPSTANDDFTVISSKKFTFEKQEERYGESGQMDV